MLRASLSFVLILSFLVAKAGRDSLSLHQKRMITYGSLGTGLVYAGSMTALGHAWYKDQSSGKFHFFNDLDEWGGMDKLGHITTSWWITSWLTDIQLGAGLPEKGAINRAALTTALFMTTIEVFDGFSQGYGFSVSDIGANITGIGSAVLQQKLFGEQVLLHRYSFVNTTEARYRPELLGQTQSERMLKNYNGQTYWISFPIKGFFAPDSRFPEWLCLSAGHSISGFLSASGTNNGIKCGDLNIYPNSRIHEWKLSLDIDLSRIRWRSRFWKAFTSTVRWIKIPAPVFSFSRKQGMFFSPIQW